MDSVAKSQAASLARQMAAKNKRNANARAQETANMAARNATNAAAEKEARLAKNEQIRKNIAKMRNIRLQEQRDQMAETQMLKENPALNGSIKANKTARLVNIRKANGWGIGLGGRRSSRKNKTRRSSRK